MGYVPLEKSVTELLTYFSFSEDDKHTAQRKKKMT